MGAFFDVEKRKRYTKDVSNLEVEMESVFRDSAIRLKVHSSSDIPATEDVLYLLRLSPNPSKRYKNAFERPDLHDHYIRNVSLVAASVADELLHCPGCINKEKARVVIQEAITILTPEPKPSVSSHSAYDVCC